MLILCNFMRLNRKTSKERLYRQGAVFVQRLKNRHLHNAKRGSLQQWHWKKSERKKIIKCAICTWLNIISVQNQSIQPSVSKINCQDCCLALSLSPGVTHDHAVWKAQKASERKKSECPLFLSSASSVWTRAKSQLPRLFLTTRKFYSWKHNAMFGKA